MSQQMRSLALAPVVCTDTRDKKGTVDSHSCGSNDEEVAAEAGYLRVHTEFTKCHDLQCYITWLTCLTTRSEERGLLGMSEKQPV